MQNNNFIVIQGWMCNELNLKGNELLIYALIYGFSQDSVSSFYGGRKYISETFNISLPTVDKALRELLKKGYIQRIKSDDYINPDGYWIDDGVVKKLYEGSKETLLEGSKETLLEGSKETLPNNIDNKNIEKKKKTNTKVLVENFTGKQPTKKQSLWQKCTGMIDEYTNNKELSDLLFTYLRMRLEIKDKPIYSNQWKGMLNKLSKLSNDTNEQCRIVEQSIDRGYLGFFEVKHYNKKSITEREGMNDTRDTHTKEQQKEIKEGMKNEKYERI